MDVKNIYILEKFLLHVCQTKLKSFRYEWGGIINKKYTPILKKDRLQTIYKAYIQNSK